MKADQPKYPTPTNLEHTRYDSVPDLPQPFLPPPLLPDAVVVTPLLEYVHLAMHPGMLVVVNVQVYRQLVTGDSCFNDRVHEQLEAAKEEVRHLTEANLQLEQDRALMDEADQGNKGMLQYSVISQDKRGKEHAELIRLPEQEWTEERNAFRLRIDRLAKENKQSKLELQRTKRDLKNRYTTQARVSDLLKEFNNFGNRK
jgi:hypothetical protein